MRIEEFDAFKGELKQLCASLSKPYTDALGQAYWRVLRDIPLAEVEANVERILLSAGKDTKFPRPVELRTTPTQAQTAMPDKAMELNAQCWRAKFAKNARLAQIELDWCRHQRIIVSTAPDSPAHAEAWVGTAAILARHGDPRYFDYGAA